MGGMDKLAPRKWMIYDGTIFEPFCSRKNPKKWINKHRFCKFLAVKRPPKNVISNRNARFAQKESANPMLNIGESVQIIVKDVFFAHYRWLYWANRIKRPFMSFLRFSRHLILEVDKKLWIYIDWILKC